MNPLLGNLPLRYKFIILFKRLTRRRPRKRKKFNEVSIYDIKLKTEEDVMYAIYDAFYSGEILSTFDETTSRNLNLIQ